MKRLVIAAGLAVAVGAAAQEPSTLMPPAPQPQPGQQTWYPGQPLPPPPAAQAAPAAPGAAPKAPSGIILGDEEEGGVSQAPGAPVPTVPPESYTVQRGDTLWDLSARFYGNPWAWPKLWSYNPAITNPHWIYPGDLLHLGRPGAEAAPPPPPEASNLPRRIIGLPRGRTGVFLRQTGFVEPGELARAGTIVGSKEEKLMLGTLDEAYVAFPKDKPFQVGERYTIYHPTSKVKHPVTGKTLGRMVEILGEGEVRAVTDGGIARIAIIDSVNPIERGFLVGPLRRQFKIVQPRADERDLQGVVVATLHPRELIGTENLVFLDRGKQDGVEIGNRFLITRRGDGYQPIRASGPVDDKRFPRETIAEVIVVDLRDHFATGWVTRATKEARVGDRVETRRGF